MVETNPDAITVEEEFARQLQVEKAKLELKLARQKENLKKELANKALEQDAIRKIELEKMTKEPKKQLNVEPFPSNDHLMIEQEREIKALVAEREKAVQLMHESTQEKLEKITVDAKLAKKRVDKYFQEQLEQTEKELQEMDEKGLQKMTEEIRNL